MGANIINSKYALIIPAAGLSSRIQPNKLLYELEGEPVIYRTLKSLEILPWETHVIVGNMAQELQAALVRYPELRLNIHLNRDYQTGLSGSIRLGLQSAGPGRDYYVFCPADKPFIKTETLQACLDVIEKEKPPILIPRYQGINGHPSFFAGEFYEELRSVTGDVGGRKVVARHREIVSYLETEDQGVILDMDAYLQDKGTDK